MRPADEDGARRAAQRILEERAQALARPLAEPASLGTLIEILRLSIGGERYAIETRFVREVTRAAVPTPVPGTPDFIAGLVVVHGEVLAVIDFCRLLGTTRAQGGFAELVVCGEREAEFGLLADTVDDVVSLPTAELHPAPDCGRQAGYLRGVTKDALIVLDGTALLAEPRFFVDHKSAEDKHLEAYR
jgi:purine-binding chemotaxis protein CheW